MYQNNVMVAYAAVTVAVLIPGCPAESISGFTIPEFVQYQGDCVTFQGKRADHCDFEIIAVLRTSVGCHGDQHKE